MLFLRGVEPHYSLLKFSSMGSLFRLSQRSERERERAREGGGIPLPPPALTVEMGHLSAGDWKEPKAVTRRVERE